MDRISRRPCFGPASYRKYPELRRVQCHRNFSDDPTALIPETGKLNVHSVEAPALNQNILRLDISMDD